MRVITLLNQKGGVGKTTTCINLGAALSLRGFKCLLIDIDPQGNLSQSAGLDDLSEEEPTTYEVLTGSADINQAIRSTQSGYNILPTDIRLSAAEIELASAERRNHILKNALRGLKRQYDFVLIDPPPSLNIFTVMTLTAATEVIIPVQAQYLPLRGVATLRDTVKLIKQRFNPELKIAGVLLTFYHSNQNLDNDVREALETAFGDRVFKTMISQNSKIAEAPSYGLDVIAYSARSKGATQYKQLAGEILGENHETTEGG